MAESCILDFKEIFYINMKFSTESECNDQNEIKYQMITSLARYEHSNHYKHYRQIILQIIQDLILKLYYLSFLQSINMKLKIILTIFIPLMITLFLVIFLPSALLLFANPKQEALYISSQIKNHQVSFRNVVYQDQRVIQKLIQSWEDIRNSLISIYISNLTYQSYQDSNIVLEVAGSYVGAQLNQSMYYNTSDQTSTYNSYLGVQLYIRSFIPDNQAILSISWIFQSGIQFWFPTTEMVISEDYNMYSQSYNTTIYNFQNYGTLYSSFPNGNIIEICTVITNLNTLFGVQCMNLDLSVVFNSQSIVAVEEMTHLLLATTISSPDQTPIVVFMSNTSTGISFPSTLQKMSEVDSQINNTQLQELKSYWYANTSYKFYVKGFIQQIWYQFPIIIYNYQQKSENMFFLFAQSVINSTQYSLQIGTSYIIEVTVIPIVLFAVSVMISYIILNKMINNLVNEVQVLVKKSKSLLEDDLDIKIPEYNQTQEVRKVYQSFQKFSEIAKYSQKFYFSGNNTQKTIKYYKALKLYTQLGNNAVIGNIYQNLANLSTEEGNLQKASQQYKSSLDSVSEVIVQQFQRQTNKDTIKELYQYLLETGKRIPNHAKHFEITLIRRFYNFIETSFRICNQQNFSDKKLTKKLISNLEEFTIILKQRKNDPCQIIVNLMAAEIYLSEERYELTQEKLKLAEKLYRQYQIIYQSGQQPSFKTPPEILYQYLSFLWGYYSQEQDKPLQAFQYYVAALDGQTYDPLLRQKILYNLKKLLITEDLHSSTIRQSVYFQPKTNQPKEYFLVLDFSLSMGSRMKIKNEITTRINLAVNEALRIFDQHIRPHDRVSFIKFQLGIQLVFNLTQKGKYERMLRGTIEQMAHSDLHDGTALYNTLKAVTINIRNLKKPKVIILIIDGADNCSHVKLKELQQLIKGIDMLTLLFICIDINQQELKQLYEIRNYCQTCYFVTIFDQDDINRILKGKSHHRHYPESYIL